MTPSVPAGERWWQEPGVFGDRDCDPISLEPLAELDYPPFGLSEAGVWHFFDGAVLATRVGRRRKSPVSAKVRRGGSRRRRGCHVDSPRRGDDAAAVA